MSHLKDSSGNAATTNALTIVSKKLAGCSSTQKSIASIPISNIATGMHIPIPHNTAFTNHEVDSGCGSCFQMYSHNNMAGSSAAEKIKMNS